jgi:hypothetical protein
MDEEQSETDPEVVQRISKMSLLDQDREERIASIWSECFVLKRKVHFCQLLAFSDNLTTSSSGIYWSCFIFKVVTLIICHLKDFCVFVSVRQVVFMVDILKVYEYVCSNIFRANIHSFILLRRTWKSIPFTEVYLLKKNGWSTQPRFMCRILTPWLTKSAK